MTGREAACLDFNESKHSACLLRNNRKIEHLKDWGVDSLAIVPEMILELKLNPKRRESDTKLWQDIKLEYVQYDTDFGAF